MRISAIAFCLAGLTLCFAAGARGGEIEGLLQPDEAFELTAELEAADSVRLSWNIAEGYYLYRQKFAFVSENAEVGIGAPSFPAGQIKQDQHFGAVEVYRDRLQLDLPIQRSAANPASLKLEVSFQGCADAGVCYMPIKKNITLDLVD